MPSPFRPALDTLETREVPAIITVTGTGDSIAVDGFITLREALTAANTNAASGDAGAGDAGLDTINFNIAGLPGTVHTIQPMSALPTITEAVFIDGYSQLGASPNTLATGTNAFLVIELDGTNAGFTAGLVVSGGGSTVQGLVINSFKNEGILILGQGGNTILGNFLGTDATGKIDRGNGVAGVALFSSNNTIGDTNPSGRNIISGNDFSGISIVNPTATGNVIQGNLIGTDDTGLAPLGNNGAGVRLFNGLGNTVGGATAGAGNVIAFNTGAGVVLSSGAGTGNAILGNSIFSNSGLGIDLNNDGVTPNDVQDTDGGPNALQNTPVITGAFAGAVTGTLNSIPNTTFRIELFANDAANADEGRTFLGFTAVTTDSAGNASFSFPAALAAGTVVTATVTDVLARNTSEFSTAASVGAQTVGTPGAGTKTHLVAVGSGSGLPIVRVYNADGSERFSFFAFPAVYQGGVRVATGDVTGDGTDDIVVGTATGFSFVGMFDGNTGAQLGGFFAFPGFLGGVSVAAGDITGDGFEDIVVGTATGPAVVSLFDGRTSGLLGSFLAFPGFNGGINVAAGDVNGDGFADVAVGTARGPSAVATFDVHGGGVLNFFAVPIAGGVNVALGDVTGDGRADLILGGGEGAPAYAAVLDGTTTGLLSVFYAFPSGTPGGSRVAADDLDGDGRVELILGAGFGSRVRTLRGFDLSPGADFFALGPTGLFGGVFVG